MGEMADYYMTTMSEQEEAYLEWASGNLDIDEAIELGILDELGYDLRYTVRTKTCRCCGTPGLVWKLSKTGKWLLHSSDGELHHCPVNPYNPQ